MTAASPNPFSPQRHALLLVGHGTRDASGQREFAETARRVAKRLPDTLVAHGFLELATPSVSQAIGGLVRSGISRLTIAPMLLFEAAHARRDIPREVARATEPFNNVTYQFSRAYGPHKSILQLSAQRFDEAITERPIRPAAETLLILVGRGNRDPQAQAAMRHFGELRQRQSPVRAVVICYLAMAEPALADALAAAGASGSRRVVVQPHLLFHGELVARIGSEIAQCRLRHPEVDWVVTQQLGPHELLVDATIEGALEAGLPNLGRRSTVEPR